MAFKPRALPAHSICRRPKREAKHSLLGLPAELRNQIFSLVFAAIEDKVLLPITEPRRTLSTQLKKRCATKRTRHLSLLQTCRQLRAECIGFVHGIVHAEMRTGSGVWWTLKRLISNDLLSQLRAANSIGKGTLESVTNLDLHGSGTLRMLIGHPNASTVDRYNSKSALQRRGAKLSIELGRTRQSLPNVQCITVVAESIDRIDFRDQNDMWLIVILWTKAERQRLRAAFPRLSQLRIVSAKMGKRYRLVGEVWEEWYGGATIPFLD